jgi:hypothetical protein
MVGIALLRSFVTRAIMAGSRAMKTRHFHHNGSIKSSQEL